MYNEFTSTYILTTYADDFDCPSGFQATEGCVIHNYIRLIISFKQYHCSIKVYDIMKVRFFF